VTVHRHFFISAPNPSDRSHLASSACLEVRHSHDRSSQLIVVTRARYRCVLITNFQGCACVRWSKKSTRPTVPTQRSAETVQIPRPNGGIRFLGRRHIQYRQAHTHTHFSKLSPIVAARGGGPEYNIQSMCSEDCTNKSSQRLMHTIRFEGLGSGDISCTSPSS
jgi:hypothetical protein